MNTFVFKKTYIFNLLIALIVFVLSPSILHAQIETPDYTTGSNTPSIQNNDLLISELIPGINEQVGVDIVPENPKPGEEVTITLNLYSTDINTKLIVWKVGGKEVSKGIGKKEFKFTVGAAGSTTKVDSVIFLKSGKPLEKSFTFSPVNVDLLWQAHTYTPPFYKGKALFTPESEVTFVSLPNMISEGVRIDPKDVVYRWTQDYEFDDKASGFYKNSFEFKGPIILKQNTIQSEAYSASNPKIQGSNSMKLDFVYPQATVYEESPSLGVLFNKAISGEYEMDKKEIKFSVFPFFFSTKNKNTLVSYDWGIDDSKIEIPTTQNSSIFRRVDATKGSAFIKIVIGNATHILQEATASFRLKYE